MLTLVIQAGGESKRMGSDKALLPFMGKPLILRPLSRLSALADEVLVTSNDPERYHFLGLTPVPDIFPGLGALSGLFTALSLARHPYVAVVGCDMPFASPALFSLEVSLLRQLEVDAVMPCSAEGIEPFHAVYQRQTCLPHIYSALQAGMRRVDAWFTDANIHFLQPDEILPHDPHQLAFLNVNTPDELELAEKIARQEAADNV